MATTQTHRDPPRPWAHIPQWPTGPPMTDTLAERMNRRARGPQDRASNSSRPHTKRRGGLELYLEAQTARNQVARPPTPWPLGIKSPLPLPHGCPCTMYPDSIGIRQCTKYTTQHKLPKSYTNNPRAYGYRGSMKQSNKTGAQLGPIKFHKTSLGAHWDRQANHHIPVKVPEPTRTGRHNLTQPGC